MSVVASESRGLTPVCPCRERAPDADHSPDQAEVNACPAAVQRHRWELLERLRQVDEEHARLSRQLQARPAR
jgi:hypothetical protein